MSDILYALQTQPQAILSISTSGADETIIRDGFGGTPDGIQVDDVSGTIYWTNMGSDFAKPDGTIEASNLDGSDHRLLVGHGAVVTPKQLVLDAIGGHLYWCDREGMRVMRCNLDGTEVTTLVQTGNYPDDMSDQTLHCVGIAVDKRAGKLYWTQKGPSDGGTGRLFRADLFFSEHESPVNRPDAELLLDHLPEPIDLEIDHQTNTLYWTDRGNLAGGNSLNRATITAEGLVDRAVVATGLEEGIGLALDRAARNAYVSDLGGFIRVSSLAEAHEFRTIAKLGPITGIAFARAR